MSRRTGVAVLAATFLAVTGAAVVPTPAQAVTPTCFGRAATIVGTGSSETIRGTSGPDVIVGRGGSDTIDGRGGDDWICDPSGPNDLNSLHGGAGDDHVRGAMELEGGPGDDVLIVDGTAGSTVHVVGGTGADTLRAPVLKALFVPGPGRDLVVGNDIPDDEVSYRSSGYAVQVDLAAGVAVGQGRDTLKRVDWATGSRYGDLLRGTGGPNGLTGLRGGDTLKGRGGADFLTGGQGADLLDGGAGDDYCDGGLLDEITLCEHGS